MISRARDGIRMAELDTQCVRGRLDQLLVDGWSRDDMKQWLKDPKGKS